MGGVRTEDLCPQTGPCFDCLTLTTNTDIKVVYFVSNLFLEFFMQTTHNAVDS